MRILRLGQERCVRRGPVRHPPPIVDNAVRMATPRLSVLLACGALLTLLLAGCSDEPDRGVEATTAPPADIATATAATPTPATPAAPLSAADVYARVAPSVPFIQTPSGSGSGVLIDGGYVVTNYHVVWPYEAVEVVFPGGRESQIVPVAA